MLAGLAVDEAEAAELAQLGSLCDIAASTAHDIALRTRLEPDRCGGFVRCAEPETASLL